MRILIEHEAALDELVGVEPAARAAALRCGFRTTCLRRGLSSDQASRLML
jgi:hypothetical protein